MTLTSWAKQLATGKRAFAVVVTQRGGLSFRLLREDDSRLVDSPRGRTYAVDRAPVPTNWRGRLSRAYLILEHDEDSIAAGEGTSGHTSAIIEPSELTDLESPPEHTKRGTRADAIYDRALSAQMRRLGNRRFNRAEAALMITAGLFITSLILAGATIATHKPAAPTNHVPAPSPQGPALPTSPRVDPTILVQSPQSGPSGDPAG